MCIVALFACTAAEAASPLRLHGVVLAVTPQTGTVVVRHDAFGGMPAMTMPFRVVPRERARELQAGAVIDADVDDRTDPWTLRNVASSVAQAVTSGPVMRSVTPLRIGDTVPDVPFVDQAGRPFRFSAWRGEDVVLAFIYTRCQDARMCPLISAKFHALQSAAGRRRVHLVEVTLDPTYDRPPVLMRYAKTFEANATRWTLAVGDADATLDFAARFGIVTFPDPNVGIIHSENTVLIGPDGRIGEMITDASWTPEELVGQLDALDGHATTPIERAERPLATIGAAIFGNDTARLSSARDLAVAAIVIGALGYLVRRLYVALAARHV
jgi:protein SCO1/2